MSSRSHIPPPRPSHQRATRLPVDVTALDNAAVMAIVFPGSIGASNAPLAQWKARGTASGWTSGALPAGWRCGEMPGPALPIDGEVARLQRPRPRDNHSLAASQLAALGIRCPFYAARQAVVMAARVARHQAVILRERDALATMAEKGRGLARSVDTYLAGLPDDVEKSVTPLDQRPDPIRAFRLRERRAERRAAIRALVGLLQAEADDLTSAVPDDLRADWHLGFARSLLFVWFVLTGELPSPKEGSRFQGFVSAAYQTLDRISRPDWTSTCKRARWQVANWTREQSVDWMVMAPLPGAVLRLRRFNTMDQARAVAERMAATLLRVSRPLLAETRTGLEAHGADLIALAVAAAEDSPATFPEVLEIARRIEAFRRSAMATVRTPPDEGGSDFTLARD